MGSVWKQGKIIWGSMIPVQKRSEIIREWGENIWGSMIPVWE